LTTNHEICQRTINQRLKEKVEQTKKSDNLNLPAYIVVVEFSHHLIAFACKKSFELGKGHYLGFLSFDSKTELISLYQDKYGATWAMGQKMFIGPANGKKLMEKYLGIKPEGK
jgi:hypothetical protein